jgi:transcriptional regulator with XRE-family HTH domain
MAFAAKLKGLREEKGLSREDLAGASGLSRGAIRDYEQGHREPSLASAFKLAEALGVSVEVFKDGAGDPEIDAPDKATHSKPAGKPGRPPKSQPEAAPAPKKPRKKKGT